MKLSNHKDALPIAQTALSPGNTNPVGAFTTFFKEQIDNGIKNIQITINKNR
ncbi:MAG: hypothetical protein QM669_09535 [Siphonobacter sp.]